MDEEEYLEILEEQKAQVERILAEYPQARDNDWVLVILTLFHFYTEELYEILKLLHRVYKKRKFTKLKHPVTVKVKAKRRVQGEEERVVKFVGLRWDEEDVEVLMRIASKLPSPETPPRLRREIQNNEGRFKPSEEVEEGRREKEELMRRLAMRW